jgi:WASH complex subunit 7
MFGALRDCVLPLKQARHDPPELLLDVFNQEISKYFDEVKPISKPLQKEQRFWAKTDDIFQHFLAPVCRQIETDLRLHIHQHLQVGDRNPFRVCF